LDYSKKNLLVFEILSTNKFSIIFFPFIRWAAMYNQSIIQFGYFQKHSGEKL